MKDEDRVTEILSSKGDMEPDTLEKIDDSVSAFSEEQKKRIYDLVIQKKSRADTENEERTGDDEMIKDDKVPFFEVRKELPINQNIISLNTKVNLIYIFVQT